MSCNTPTPKQTTKPLCTLFPEWKKPVVSSCSGECPGYAKDDVVQLCESGMILIATSVVDCNTDSPLLGASRSPKTWVVQTFNAVLSTLGTFTEIVDLGGGEYAATNANGSVITWNCTHSVTVDNGDGTYSTTNSNGLEITWEGKSVEISATSDGNLEITAPDGSTEVITLTHSEVADNGDGSYTWTSADSATSVTWDGETPTFSTDGAGNLVITHPDGSTQTVSLEHNALVDNGDGSFTWTSADGATILTWSGESPTITSDGAGGLTITNPDGTTQNIPLTHNDVVDNGDGSYTWTSADSETSVTWTGDAPTVATDGAGGLTITNPDGTTTPVSITHNTVADNGDGSYTWTSADSATAITWSGSAVSIASDGAGGLTITNPDGSTTPVDLPHNTLVDNADGTYTWTDADGATAITWTGDAISIASDGTGGLTITNPDGTTTPVALTHNSVVDNTDGTYTWTDADGATAITWTGDAISIASDGAGGLTITNPDGSTTPVALGHTTAVGNTNGTATITEPGQPAVTVLLAQPNALIDPTVSALRMSASDTNSAISIGRSVDTHQFNETTLGVGAGEGNTTSSLTAVGSYAGENNTGYDVTTLSRDAGRDNTGDGLTAVGLRAAQSNAAPNVVAVGNNAGKDNLAAGVGLTAVGVGAGQGNTAARNTHYGYHAGRVAEFTNGFSTDLVTAGYEAFKGGTGLRNVVMGSHSGPEALLTYSVIIGTYAGSGTASVTKSVYIGEEAGKDAAADNAVGVGAYSMISADNDSIRATAVGTFAGHGLKLSPDSSMCGAYAGTSAEDASFSVFMGNGAGAYSLGAWNAVCCGVSSGKYSIGGNLVAVGAVCGAGNIGGDCVFVGANSSNYSAAEQMTSCGYGTQNTVAANFGTLLGAHTGYSVILGGPTLPATFDPATDYFTVTGHGLGVAGDYALVTLGGTPPSGFSASAIMVKVIDANTLHSWSQEGTDAGASLTITRNQQNDFHNSTAVGYQATIAQANQIVLGNHNVTQVFTYGDIVANGTSYPSDRRLKKHILPIADSEILSSVAQIHLKNFEWDFDSPEMAIGEMDISDPEPDLFSTSGLGDNPDEGAETETADTIATTDQPNAPKKRKKHDKKPPKRRNKRKTKKLYMKSERARDVVQTGLIAQDVQAVFPEAVKEVNGILTIDSTVLGAAAIAAVGALTRRLDAIESKLVT